MRREQTIPMVRAHCPDCGWRFQDRDDFTERVAAAKMAAAAHARKTGHRVEVEDPRVIVYDGGKD